MDKGKGKTRQRAKDGERREIRVSDLMRAEVITTSPNTTARDALRIMEKNRIRHLPVVVGEKLVGLLSQRELYLYLTSFAVFGTAKEGARAGAAEDLVGVRIESIMSRDPYTIGPSNTLEEAARLMSFHRLSALPVVEGDRLLVGILTTQDILTHLSEAFQQEALED